MEPDPAHTEIGRRNAELNNVQLEISDGYIGADDLPPAPFRTETSGVRNVPMRRARTICADFAPDGLDLLHLDIQGAETIAIQDCEPLFLAGAIRFLVVSTHGEDITQDPLTHQECLAMIERYGGRILAEHDVHESFSGDGLIAAYFGKEPIEWPELELSRNRYATSFYRNPLYDVADLHTKSRRLADRLSMLEAAEAENKILRRERDTLEKSLKQIRGSTIWRTTTPLRKLLHAVLLRLGRRSGAH